MGTRMQQRRGTAAQWTAANPTLADGEIGFARDTGIFKIGDGITPWNSLPIALDAVFIGPTDQAADSVKLGGFPASDYARSTDPAAPFLLKSGGTITSDLTVGDADNDRMFQRSMVVETHTRSVDLGYTGTSLTTVTEKVGGTTVRTTTLTYTNGKLTQVTEVAAGKTVTKTLVYSGETLTSVTRTVV